MAKAATPSRPRGVYLVGKVALSDSEAVIREVSMWGGDHLRRAPDGETGVRTYWIQWQLPLLLDVHAGVAGPA